MDSLLPRQLTRNAQIELIRITAMMIRFSLNRVWTFCLLWVRIRVAIGLWFRSILLIAPARDW